MRKWRSFLMDCCNRQILRIYCWDYRATNPLKKRKWLEEKIGISFIRSCTNSQKVRRDNFGCVYTKVVLLGFMLWDLPPTLWQPKMKTMFHICSHSTMFVFYFIFAPTFMFSLLCLSFRYLHVFLIYFWSDVIS